MLNVNMTKFVLHQKNLSRKVSFGMKTPQTQYSTIAGIQNKTKKNIVSKRKCIDYIEKW